MNLYAYCLCREIDESVLAATSGLAGTQPFVMTYEGIVAVVSEFDSGPITVTRENVLAHEKVISQVFAQTTPLPFRFGALLRPAELDGYVTLNRKSLIAMLARVQGAAEMSVKIIDKGGPGADGMSKEQAVTGAETAEMGQGAMFLAAKQREVADRKMIEERGKEISSWLDEQLANVVNDSFVRLRPTPGLVLKAAHLVERSRLEEYRDRVRRARDERPELLFLTSGPWPPYSFCDLTTRTNELVSKPRFQNGVG